MEDRGITCLKRGYKSKRAALAAHARFGGRLRVYYCEDCCLWHVTASEKR